jgi:hypothetical protein
MFGFGGWYFGLDSQICPSINCELRAVEIIKIYIFSSTTPHFLFPRKSEARPPPLTPRPASLKYSEAASERLVNLLTVAQSESPLRCPGLMPKARALVDRLCPELSGQLHARRVQPRERETAHAFFFLGGGLSTGISVSKSGRAGNRDILVVVAQSLVATGPTFELSLAHRTNLDFPSSSFLDPRPSARPGFTRRLFTK